MPSTLKKFIKHIIRYNVLDYGVPRLRKLYKKLGILEFMDTRFYWLAWKIVHWVLRDKIWTGKTIGAANVPPTGAAIFVPNHSHALDPFFSGVSIYRKVHWVSKIENYSHPFFRPILQCTGSIPLRRGKSDKNAIRLIKAELDKGEMIGMFPEGTRTKDGSLMHFHTGAARLCLEYNIPYIPVGIVGSYKTKMGDKIDVHIGKPRYPNGMKLNYENARKFTALMEQDIRALSGQQETLIPAVITPISTASPVEPSPVPLKAPEQVIIQ